MSKTSKKSKRTEAKAEAVAAEPMTAQPVKVESAASELAQPQPVRVTIAKPELPKAGWVSLELVKPEARTVCVAGSFNQWKPEQTPLTPEGNGRWVGNLAVDPGRYEYLFVVDGQWLPDPNAKESVQNPYGGKNSVLTVSE